MFFFVLFLRYIFPIREDLPTLFWCQWHPPSFLVILPPCHPGTVLKPNELKQHKLPRSQQIRFRPTKSNFCHQRKENQYHTNNKQWCDWWPKSWLNLGACVFSSSCCGVRFFWKKYMMLVCFKFCLQYFCDFVGNKSAFVGFGWWKW